MTSSIFQYQLKKYGFQKEKNISTLSIFARIELNTYNVVIQIENTE